MARRGGGLGPPGVRSACLAPALDPVLGEAGCRGRREREAGGGAGQRPYKEARQAPHRAKQHFLRRQGWAGLGGRTGGPSLAPSSPPPPPGTREPRTSFRPTLHLGQVDEPTWAPPARPPARPSAASLPLCPAQAAGHATHPFVAHPQNGKMQIGQRGWGPLRQAEEEEEGGGLNVPALFPPPHPPSLTLFVAATFSHYICRLSSPKSRFIPVQCVIFPSRPPLPLFSLPPPHIF